jgi:hypothetical protein
LVAVKDVTETLRRADCIAWAEVFRLAAFGGIVDESMEVVRMQERGVLGLCQILSDS